jgi:molybdopterin converting factor subunit 1
MITKISFYAVLREITGVNQVELEIPDNCSVNELRGILLKEYPRLRQGLETAIIAIDHSHSDDNITIKPGMEVSIFPPIVGG